jgi:hypothetical protein
MRLRLALVMLLAHGSMSALDKAVTMYHVNPLRFGPVPRNMDTADVAGDLFFELFEVLSIPLACSDPSVPASDKPFECRNLESNDPTDVVNKLTLRVNSSYSSYAMCNIGNKSGMDPLGRPCPADVYCCFCDDDNHTHHHHHHGFHPHVVPCNATVGRAELYSHFNRNATGNWSHDCTSDYDCWTSHAGAKLTKAIPGYWYSPTSLGDCSAHPASPDNCTWEVQSIDKIVNRTCHSNSFFGAVQAAAPEPFKPCHGGGKTPPNATDPCWIRGFYTAVLGPNAATPTNWSVAGLPLADLVRYWSAPFDSDDPAKGGCPGLPIPPDAAARHHSIGGAAKSSPAIVAPTATAAHLSFEPPVEVSSHRGRSDADSFVSFSANPDAMFGKTLLGGKSTVVSSMDGGQTWEDNTKHETLAAGYPFGIVGSPPSSVLRSIGTTSRYYDPMVSQVFGDAFSDATLDHEARTVAFSETKRANLTSWSGFPLPVSQFTVYPGQMVQLGGSPPAYGKSVVVCTRPPSTLRPYGCNLVPHHNGTRYVWGASNHSVWWFRSADLLHWKFASEIASAESLRRLGVQSEEGANENAVTLTANGSLLAVMRVDGGDGDPNHLHRPFVQSLSHDGGLSWSPPRSLGPSVLSARPMLLRVPNGRTGGASLLLTGGRPRLMLWANWAGDGAAWESINLAAAHNTHARKGTPTFCPEYVYANDTDKKRVEQSPAYNSVVLASADPTSGAPRALACYSLGNGDLDPGGKPKGCVLNVSHVFCMRLTLN